MSSTEAERAALAARHQPGKPVKQVAFPEVRLRFCGACGQPWDPDGCDTARALALPPDLKTLATRLAYVLGQHVDAPSVAAAVIAAWDPKP